MSKKNDSNEVKTEEKKAEAKNDLVETSAITEKEEKLYQELAKKHKEAKRQKIKDAFSKENLKKNGKKVLIGVGLTVGGIVVGALATKDSSESDDEDEDYSDYAEIDEPADDDATEAETYVESEVTDESKENEEET